jgi:asparagine synthase (glutamine-hydrolysing)
MCGILGWVRCGPGAESGHSADSANADALATHHSAKPNLTPERFAKALRLIRHRGPDACRMVFFPQNQAPQLIQLGDTCPELLPLQAALGHARLSIIDLSDCAAQPMSRTPADRMSPPGASNEQWLTFNGEIYNYKALRSELQAQGQRFESQSDTEVLLALFSQADGPPLARCLQQLNGMFAFGLWDVERQRLLLARDRYGIKPLYYTLLPNGGGFAFASEIKSLLALGADKSLNLQALSEHLTFQNTFGDRTLLAHIHCLQPGHWAELDAQIGELRIERYWQPVFGQAESPSLSSEWPERLLALFEGAVGSQLVGDVPIGSFLSGGMDTGAISAVASRTLAGLHTFTAGFEVAQVSPEEQLFDERQVSRELAARYGTRHHELTIGSAALTQTLMPVVWHLDDFRAGISYQAFLVSQMVKESVTVVLSGVGGDELFAGYPWRYQPALGFDAANSPGFSDLYYQSWVRLLSEEEKRRLFTPQVLLALGDYSSRDSFNAVWENCQAQRPLDKALCFDMQTFMHGLLVVEDRLSMAHSVESRVPFLDNALVDFCLNLPGEVKLRPSGNLEQPPTAKWILKEALRHLLPAEVLQRRKQGFTPPDATWYRTVHRAYIEQLLLSPMALQRGLFRPDGLREILEAHFSGQRNHRFLIWSLMCLECWHRLLLDPVELIAPDPIFSP